MWAQINQLLEEDWRRRVLEEAVAHDKTPIDFYIKAAIMISVIIGIIFVMKKYADKKNNK